MTLRSIPRYPACRLQAPVRVARRSYSPTRPLPPKVEPTVFASKAQPREVHYRPEHARGMPPAVKRPWEQLRRANMGTGQKGEEASLEEAFDGPSKPRMYYDRPADRELPLISVSHACTTSGDARKLMNRIARRGVGSSLFG
jgi:hypothetical protein